MFVVRTDKIEESLNDFLCPVCSLLVFHPVQLCCGHRFCRLCINEQHELVKCVQCETFTPRDDIFPDRGFENDMAKLSIQCGTCSWIGRYKTYQNHLNAIHPDGEINPKIRRSFKFTIRELRKQLENSQMHARFTRNQTQQMVDLPLQDRIGVEEKTPHENMRKEKDNSYVSCDGTMIVRIPDIRKKLTEPGCLFTSAPFCTSSAGYKMCIRLHFDGNDIGKSTHLSAYLIMMRGDYDEMLSWPFNFQITFGLYDQGNHKDHIIESFLPDPASASFQRPQGDMNIPCGIPKFVPLNELYQPNSPYISEGTIYIKVTAREQAIPSHIFKFSMMMDHWGIPIYLQEEKIKEEMEKAKNSTLTLHLSLTSRRCL